MTYFFLCFAGLQFPDRIRNVRAAHNRVTLEDAASAPAADLHDDRFSDASAPKIARCGPAKIVEDQAGVTGSLESALYTMTATPPFQGHEVDSI